MQTLLSDYGDLITWVGVISSFCFFASLAIIPLVICRLHDDYFFHIHEHSKNEDLHPLAFALLRLLRYLLGAILLVAGFLMLFLPGQGLLTMILGISLLDFPGKQQAVDKLLQIQSIQNSLNWIRKKGNKNTFTFPETNT